MSAIVLHGYWRSSAAYRVRIALAVKGVPYRHAPHNLLKNEQRDAAYLAEAPHGLVPALEVDGQFLIESPAILEWLEARYPEPPLLPRDPDQAAIMRAMCAIIACDIHPLNNLRVLNELRREFGADDDRVKAWAGRWISAGFEALEALIGQHGAGYAFGNSVTVADCYLVPQVYNARRFHVDLSRFTRLEAAADAAATLSAFVAAHPDNQPDAVR